MNIGAFITLSAIVISLQGSGSTGSFGFLGRHAQQVVPQAFQSVELPLLSWAGQASVEYRSQYDDQLPIDKDPSSDTLSTDSSKTSIIGFPIVYRTPETRWATTSGG